MLRLLSAIVLIFAASASVEAAPRDVARSFSGRPGINLDWWTRVADGVPIPSRPLLKRLADVGFGHIRYALNPSSIIVGAGNEFRLACEADEQGLGERLARLRGSIAAAGLGLIITVDATNDKQRLNWLMRDKTGEALGDMLICLARSLGVGDKAGRATEVAIGTLNEPQVSANVWYDAQRHAIEKLRSVFPDLNVMGTSPFPSDLNAALSAPSLGSNIPIEVHFYEPYILTHQGLKKSPALRSIARVRLLEQSHNPGSCVAWPASGGNCITCTPPTEHPVCDVQASPEAALDRSEFERRLNLLVRLARRRPIFVTEYGLTRTARESGTEWLEKVTLALKSAGIPRTLYSLACEFGVTVRDDCDPTVISVDDPPALDSVVVRLIVNGRPSE